VAIGGLGPNPVLVSATDYVVEGFSPAALERLDQAVDETSQEAYEDLHADREYRRAMARVFARRALQAAASRLS
jgi:CO/xanthine dehydrogenase FAD-binding subunit